VLHAFEHCAGVLAAILLQNEIPALRVFSLLGGGQQQKRRKATNGMVVLPFGHIIDCGLFHRVSFIRLPNSKAVGNDNSDNKGQGPTSIIEPLPYMMTHKSSGVLCWATSSSVTNGSYNGSGVSPDCIFKKKPLLGHCVHACLHRVQAMHE